jgi:excisionase family DNA binding protein
MTRSARNVRTTAAALVEALLPAEGTTTTEAETDDVITVEECAAWLGVNKKTVYGAAGRGELPSARLGRRLLISRAAVTAWLAGRRT